MDSLWNSPSLESRGQVLLTLLDLKHPLPLRPLLHKYRPQSDTEPSPVWQGGISCQPIRVSNRPQSGDCPQSDRQGDLLGQSVGQRWSESGDRGSKSIMWETHRVSDLSCWWIILLVNYPVGGLCCWWTILIVSTESAPRPIQFINCDVHDIESMSVHQGCVNLNSMSPKLHRFASILQSKRFFLKFSK